MKLQTHWWIPAAVGLATCLALSAFGQMPTWWLIVLAQAVLIWSGLLLWRKLRGPPSVAGLVDGAATAPASKLTLSQEHQRMRWLLDATLLGVWILDKEGRTLEANPAMCRLLGREHDELLGHDVFEYFTGADLATLQREIGARQTGKKGGYEIGITRPDGSRVICINHATPVFDADGRHAGSVGMWTDVTALRLAEQNLRVYEATINSITDRVCVLNAEHVYLLVNDAWLKGNMLTRDAVIGRSRDEVSLPTRNPARDEAMRTCLADGVVQRLEAASGRLESGVTRLLEITYYPWLDPVAATRRVVVVTRDITDREHDRLAAAVNADYLRGTLNATGDAIFASEATEPHQVVRFVNHQMLQMWGIAAEQAATLTPADIMRHAAPLFKHPQEEAARVADIVATNQADESQVELVDGRVLLRRCMPVDIGGKLVRVWSFRDITDITRAQDALIAARDSADRANRQKSEFLANMSHEIRTPMNGVLGMIQLVQAGNLTKEQHQQLEMAYRSGEGLLAILNNILDVSKVEAGRLELHRVHFNLHELLMQLVELMNVGCKEKGLALQLNIDPAVPMHVHGDDVRLRQVLGNLIGNAVKFTRKGSVIVALSVESAGIGFSVQDTGIGIAADQHDGIFDAFMQADGSITRRFGGTGLGLSISSQLVRLMGGNILLYSEPGRGSCFSFTLDLPTATGRPTRSETRRLPVSRSLNVLLVEDNPVNQLVATGMLKWAGHSVATAENGIEAVRRVTNESFDLVLMDMQMPEMDGPEAARRIRQHEAAQGRRRVPIVALTASAFEADRETCRLAGMDDFLSKPLHRDSLVQAIDRALKDTRVSR